MDAATVVVAFLKFSALGLFHTAMRRAEARRGDYGSGTPVSGKPVLLPAILLYRGGLNVSNRGHLEDFWDHKGAW